MPEIVGTLYTIEWRTPTTEPPDGAPRILAEYFVPGWTSTVPRPIAEFPHSLGSGYGLSIAHLSPPIRRQAPQTLASIRQKRLRRRLETKAPMFADQLFAQEVARKEDYYLKGITDAKLEADRAQVETAYAERLARLQAHANQLIVYAAEPPACAEAARRLRAEMEAAPPGRRRKNCRRWPAACWTMRRPDGIWTTVPALSPRRHPVTYKVTLALCLPDSTWTTAEVALEAGDIPGLRPERPDEALLWKAAARKFAGLCPGMKLRAVGLVDWESTTPGCAPQTESVGTRPVEVIVCEPDSGGDSGQWYVERVDIPSDTPEELIEDVAIQISTEAHAHEAIAHLGLYCTLPPGEDEMDEDEDGEDEDESDEG